MVQPDGLTMRGRKKYIAQSVRLRIRADGCNMKRTVATPYLVVVHVGAHVAPRTHVLFHTHAQTVARITSLHGVCKELLEPRDLEHDKRKTQEHIERLRPMQ